MREARPNLVLTYIDFVEHAFDPLVISGIDGQVWGPNIIACITYRLPYTYHGSQCSITFGLADEVVCNTLVGAPFMIKGRLVHHAADNVVTSGIFGVQFPCTMEKPSRTDDLSAHVEGQQSAMWTSCVSVALDTVLIDGRGIVAS